MKTLLAGGLLLVAVSMTAHTAQPEADVLDHGRELFARLCAPCHGRGPGTDGTPMLPGTAALAAKYRGAVPAALEDRPGLTPELIGAFLRNGSGAMPMFRRTELSDDDIVAIAVYLAATAAE